jgi:hypothetical protein
MFDLSVARSRSRVLSLGRAFVLTSWSLGCCSLFVVSCYVLLLPVSMHLVIYHCGPCAPSTNPLQWTLENFTSSPDSRTVEFRV